MWRAAMHAFTRSQDEDLGVATNDTHAHGDVTAGGAAVTLPA